MIYLDNSATTKLDEEVLNAMLPWLGEHFGNASSVYSIGRRARVAIEDAREEIASLIHAHPAELIFTSGGTESNNTVLHSACVESQLARSVCYSAIEHHAVIHPSEQLAKLGIATAVLPVDSQGILNCDAAKDILASVPHRTLISVMHANNETGMIQPIARLRELSASAFLHTDAVQSFGKIPFDVHGVTHRLRFLLRS
jgi:cysteine desulfurase